MIFSFILLSRFPLFFSPIIHIAPIALLPIRFLPFFSFSYFCESFCVSPGPLVLRSPYGFKTMSGFCDGLGGRTISHICPGLLFSLVLGDLVPEASVRCEVEEKRLDEMHRRNDFTWFSHVAVVYSP
jgi:hypothetical protein